MNYDFWLLSGPGGPYDRDRPIEDDEPQEDALPKEIIMAAEKQKPHKWNRRKDAACCIGCDLAFETGDMVFTDFAVSIHKECLADYGESLIKLGLRKRPAKVVKS